MAFTAWLLNAVTGAPAYSGRKVRQTGSVLLPGATAARPLGARSGVRPGTPADTVSVSGGYWKCKPHAGVIDLQSAVESGPYLYALDAETTPAAIPAAHSSWGRVDLVWVRVDDPPEDGTGTPGGTVGYTAGTASASPASTAAVAPARCMPLAQVNVPNATTGGGAASATVTPVWQWTDIGIIPVRNQAEREAIAFATATYPVIVDQLDTGTLWRNAGSGWRQIWPRRLHGVGTPLVGATPPAGAEILEQTFIGSATTNVSGDTYVLFPTAFPNGVLAVTMQRYDFSSFATTNEVANTTQALDRFNFRVYSAGATVIPSLGPLLYIVHAIGW